MSRKPSPTAVAPAEQAGRDLIAAAEALVPMVRACREEAERLRHVPPDMAKAMLRAGLLHMYLPRA